MNCGKKGEKEDRQLRIEDVDQEAGQDRLAQQRTFTVSSDVQRPVLAQGLPGHIEQIGHAEPFQGCKRHRAGVQHGSETEHRRRDVRDDTKRAAERCGDADARSAGERRGQRIENASALGKR